MIVVAIWGAVGLILLTYVIASLIMVYHIYAFGLNKLTATVSVGVFILGSTFLWLLIIFRVGALVAELG